MISDVGIDDCAAGRAARLTVWVQAAAMSSPLQTDPQGTGSAWDGIHIGWVLVASEWTKLARHRGVSYCPVQARLRDEHPPSVDALERE
jgi:hypothetical protein